MCIPYNCAHIQGQVAEQQRKSKQRFTISSWDDSSSNHRGRFPLPQSFRILMGLHCHSYYRRLNLREWGRDFQFLLGGSLSFSSPTLDSFYWSFFCTNVHFQAFWGLFYKGTLISFMRALLSWSDHLPKAPPPSTITMGVRISTYISGGTQTFDQIF